MTIRKALYGAFAFGLLIGGGLATGAVALLHAHSSTPRDAEIVYCADPSHRSALRLAAVALGPHTSYDRACNALVALADPALKDSSSPVSPLLGTAISGSVLAALLTAGLNARSTLLAERRGRAYELVSAVFAAHGRFNREAHKFIELVRSPVPPSFPPIDKLEEYHADLSTALRELPGNSGQRMLALLTDVHKYLTGWPSAQRGKGAAERVANASQKLDDLRDCVGNINISRTTAFGRAMQWKTP